MALSNGTEADERRRAGLRGNETDGALSDDDEPSSLEEVGGEGPDPDEAADEKMRGGSASACSKRKRRNSHDGHDVSTNGNQVERRDSPDLCTIGVDERLEEQVEVCETRGKGVQLFLFPCLSPTNA